MSEKITELIFLYEKNNLNYLASLLSLIPSNLEERLNISFKTLQELFLCSTSSDKAISIVALSVRTYDLPDLQKKLNRVREVFGKEVVIIAGGPQITGMPETIPYFSIDYGVIGEGEISFWKLVEKVVFKESVKVPKGIAQNKNGRLNLSGYSEPPDFTKTSSFSERFDLFGFVEITRGCGFSCNFCQTSKIFIRKISHKPVEKILANIQFLVRRNVKVIRFLTPDASSYCIDPISKGTYGDLRCMLSEARRIAQKQKIFLGNFPSEIRPENVTEELLEIIKTYADNKFIIIGAQSGSDSMLEKMNRNHTTEDIVRSVEKILKAGLKPVVDLIFGLPEESRKEIQQNIDFLNLMVEKGAIIHSHVYMPLPGTSYYRLTSNPINSELKKVILSLSGKAKGYGQWEAQEKKRVHLKKIMDEIENKFNGYF